MSFHPGEPELVHRHRRCPRRKRLFWRVYMHGASLLVAVGVTASVIALAFHGGAPWKDIHSRIARRVATEYQRTGADPAAMTGELNELRALLTIEASLYRLDGQLVATSIDPPIPPLSAAEVGKLGRGSIERPGRGWSMVLPLEQDGRPFAYVAAHLPSRIEYPFLRGLAIMGGVMGVLALASVPLVRGIVSPLERLTATARAFGGGDLSVRSGLRLGGEAGELARAFDDMADRIEQLIRGEKELLANVSHELRTPLARIKFALELAADGNGEEARSYLREIGTDLAELERIVEDVLTTARLDLARGRAGDGAPPLRRSRLEARELIDAAVERFHANFPDRRLEVVLEPALPAVEGDAMLLRRVIDNLLDNARKYADPDQPIVLAVHRQHGGLTIEVRDRGAGIEAEDLPHLFTPFFRSDPSRTRGTGGVGLGLALAKRVVEAHDGRIEAVSMPGVGTTLRFTLPVA